MLIGSTVEVIGAIKLLIDFRKAVEDEAGSSAEYQELISALYSLESVLLQVKQAKVGGN